MIITYLQDMRNVYTILLFSMLIFSAQGCLQDLDDIFFNATAGTVAQFDYGLVDTTGTVTYEVKKSGQIAKLRLAYIAGVPGSPQLNTGVTFTGDAATGHISFDYSGAVDGDKGTYALTDTSGTELKCQTLYSLGETTVEVDQVGTANIGGSATFQCTAESATLPVRSGIVFEYRWTFGLEINPSGMKFDYDGNSFTIKDITEADKSKGCSCSAKEEVGIALFSSESKTKYIEAIEICCCCCKICCFIVLIVNVVLIGLLILVHIILTWKNHEYSIQKILYKDTQKKVVNCKDYGIKALLPGCCLCVVVIIIQLAVYFGALKQRDCEVDCDCDCEVVICLVVPIIVLIAKYAIGLVIIYAFVHLKGRNYRDPGGNVDNGNSCCGGNNSILPICAGGDQDASDGPRQQPPQRPQRGDKDGHPPDEPMSNTTKTDEAGSFVSRKDVKVETGGFRAQPPLPDIKSGNRNIRGLSANIDDPETNLSYEKRRLTPIGQESQLEWEEKTDRSEDAKEKRRKKKSKDKERDSNVTESEKL